MALYEHTVMTRQDISAQQAEALNDTIKTLIEQAGGAVAKIEYWGLRNLTYRVKKNRKAHYSLLAVDAPPAAMAEVERQLSINLKQLGCQWQHHLSLPKNGKKE